MRFGFFVVLNFGFDDLFEFRRNPGRLCGVSVHGYEEVV